jgi:uncharacterized membrane protein
VKALIIIVLVVALLIGGIMTLRSTRGTGMPDAEVLERARARAREQAAKDEAQEDP